MTKLLYGTDPELFATYTAEGKEFALPPVFFRKYLGVPASKDKKHPVFLKGDGWILHEDGAAFEMSINPSHDPKDLFDTIQDCRDNANKHILALFPNYCQPFLQALPTVNWDISRWDAEDMAFFMATRFGCDRDFNADNLNEEHTVIDASLHPARYGGGHIHVSGSKLFGEDPVLSVKALALTAGCAAILNSDVPDLDRMRTYLYGKPRKFRVQEYHNTPFGEEYSVGIEYRTPSNRWCNSWEAAQDVFKWVEIGVHNVLETKLAVELTDRLGIMATDAIINANQELAGQVLQEVENSI